MNLSNLVLEAQRLAGRVDSQYDARTQNWINEALQRWATKDPWETLSDEIEIISEGTRDLYLPGYVGKIKSIYDKTNKMPVARKEHWDRNAPTAFGQQTSGRTFYWREMGLSPIAVGRPTDPQKIRFLPTNNDATATCFVEGIRNSSERWPGVSGPALTGSIHREYVTAYSGTGANTAFEYTKIVTLGKVDATSREIIVAWLDPTTGATLPCAFLEPNEYQSRYRRAQLLYVPTSGTQFTVKYIRKVDRLTEDNEFPPPSVNPNFLIWWAAGNIHSSMQEPAEAREKWAMAEKFLVEDAYHEEAHGDQDTQSIPDPSYWGNNVDEGWVP